MFEILIKSDSEPKVINASSLDFLDYLMAGFESIFRGTKKECLNKLNDIYEQQ